jgi:hypothetical protein
MRHHHPSVQQGRFMFRKCSGMIITIPANPFEWPVSKVADDFQFFHVN